MTSPLHVLRWLIHTPAGQTCRIVAGLSILVLLAAIDLRRHGHVARRWREYVFLLCTVATALIYGIVNDQITSRMSWEYFYFGKDLAGVLGDDLPPNPLKLSWEAAKIGMMATWAVGLLVGVCCLLANNPRSDRPQLSNTQLFKHSFWPLAMAILFAGGLAAVGYRRGLAALSEDFREMLRQNQFRPRRFMAVYGAHLGGYIGGAIGTAISVLSILRARRQLTRARP